MVSKIFFALTVVASGVLAQSPTESSAAAEPSASIPAGITPCILGCVTTAAQAIGCSFSDLTCVCSSAQFQSQALQCLKANCTAQELKTAVGLQAQECDSIGATPSGPSGSVTGSAPAETDSSSSAASVSAPVSAPISAPISAPVSAPVSAPGSSGAGPVSSVRPTLTAPSISHSATGTNSISAPSQTSSSAAMGKGDGMGLFGWIAVGVFGLLL